MRAGQSDDIAIRAVEGRGLPAHLADQIDAIFFEASGRSGFASPEERTAFRERWLGRYLAGGSDVVLIAQSPEGAVVGYLVGALEDPAAQERFADIGYFCGVFRDLCRRYPAHLHINLAPAFRSRGIGACLVAAFAARAAASGAPGFHVVTAKDARNVRFYRSCGLGALATTSWNGREVVFLGRALEGPGPALTRR